MAAWTDYAVDLRVRALEPVTDTDLAEAWLALRAAYGPGSECEVYNVYLDFLPQTVSAHKVCNSTDAPIQRNGYPLDFDEWYEARIEVQGDSLQVWIEGVPVLVTQDQDVAQGYLYLSVGTGATVQFDDIRIYRILPDVEE